MEKIVPLTMNIKDAHEKYGIPCSTLRTMCRKHKIAHTIVENRYYIKISELDRIFKC